VVLIGGKEERFVSLGWQNEKPEKGKRAQACLKFWRQPPHRRDIKKIHQEFKQHIITRQQMGVTDLTDAQMFC
jgi:hypothetical protein